MNISFKRHVFQIVLQGYKGIELFQMALQCYKRIKLSVMLKRRKALRNFLAQKGKQILNAVFKYWSLRFLSVSCYSVRVAFSAYFKYFVPYSCIIVSVSFVASDAFVSHLHCQKVQICKPVH